MNTGALCRGLVSLLAVIGCKASVSASDADASPTGDDAGDGRVCDPMWLPYDGVRSCVLPREPARGLCMNTVSHSKGFYTGCAVSPEHKPYWFSASADQDIVAPGWTIAMPDTATYFGLPVASPADERACGAAANPAARSAPPWCTDIVDASDM